MGTISSSIGLITGFPIQETVDKLVALQAAPRDALTAANKKLNDKQVGITALQGLITTLQINASKLTGNLLYSEQTVTSGNPGLLSVKTAGQVGAGSYQYTPIRQVQAQQLASSRIASDTAALGGGSLSIRLGGFLNNGSGLDLLNAGLGFDRGSIRIVDRTGAAADVDLSQARTIDDVVSAINGAGLQVVAQAKNDRLRLVDTSGSTSSNLKVSEVAGGTTAASLGLAGINVAANVADGASILQLFGDLRLSRLNGGNGVRFDDALDDLEIQFRDGTTATVDFHKLAVPGTFPTGTTAGSGPNTQLEFTTTTAGSAYAGVQVLFVNDNGIVAGSNETADYDEQAQTLTFRIKAGETTAQNVIDALERNPTLSPLFTAANISGSDGSGIVSDTDTATLGGAIVEPAPGTNEQTLGDVLAALNSLDPARLSAAISGDGSRLVLTDLSVDNGGTFGVSDLNGSQAAVDLGLTITASGGTLTGTRILAGLKSSLLATLNGGKGTGPLGALQLTDRSGTSASVDLSLAETVDDVIDAINGSGLGISAAVSNARDGIVLTDTTGLTVSNLVVANGDATNSADKLQIAIDDAVTSVSSGNLKLQALNENTTLASLNGGKGVPLGTFSVLDTQGNGTTVRLTAAHQTIGDVLHELNSLGLAINARINDAGDGITIADTAHGTGTLSITDGTAATAAGLHLLIPASEQSIDSLPTQVIDGSTTFSLTLTATDSLRDLVQKINEAKIGVTASVFNDGTTVKPFRLVLTSQVAGKAGELRVDSSLLPFTLSETVAAQDALLLVNAPGSLGQLVSSTTNTFKDVLPGATLTINGTSATPISVTSSSSTKTLSDTLSSLVDGYNKVRTKIDDLTAFNAETSTSALLQGDSSLLRVESDLARLFTSRFFGLGNVQTFQSLGITVDDEGKLSFDQATFDGKFAESPAAVEQFFRTAKTGLAERIKGLADQLAGPDNSVLGNRSSALGQSIENNQQRIDRLTAHLEAVQQRLLTSFYLSEALIGKIKNNLNAISAIDTSLFKTSATISSS